MIARMPRYTYRALREGTDWILDTDDGDNLIIINEALDDADRRAALKAAYASIRRGRGPVAGLIALLAGAAAVAVKAAREAIRTPAGSAVAASVMTAGLVYGVGELRHSPPLAAPPAVITLWDTPDAVTSPSTSARSTRTPPPHPATMAPGTSGEELPERRPASIVSPPPSRDRAPTQRPSRTPPPATVPPTTRPTTAPPTRGADTSPPATATPETDAPRTRAEAADPPTSEAPAPTPQKAAAPEERCDGIALDVTLDPLLGVDACLLG
ncbi:hypothetical protein AB0J71_31750 [Nonomuraea sp. NPDC049637]|uniref:hypothetical protein n=1 Tax=Nonomuraea sp. NPDC049637 TaxID=3154356 RepID=UPI00341EDA19